MSSYPKGLWFTSGWTKPGEIKNQIYLGVAIFGLRMVTTEENPTGAGDARLISCSCQRDPQEKPRRASHTKDDFCQMCTARCPPWTSVIYEAPSGPCLNPLCLWYLSDRRLSYIIEGTGSWLLALTCYIILTLDQLWSMLPGKSGSYRLKNDSEQDGGGARL